MQSGASQLPFPGLVKALSRTSEGSLDVGQWGDASSAWVTCRAEGGLRLVLIRWVQVRRMLDGEMSCPTNKDDRNA